MDTPPRGERPRARANPSRLRSSSDGQSFVRATGDEGPRHTRSRSYDGDVAQALKLELKGQLMGAGGLHEQARPSSSGIEGGRRLHS
jgi:hypothetical protein